MPLVSNDHSFNSMSSIKRTRLSSCPYIENFGKFLKEKYEMDNRIFKRGLERFEDTERRKAEIAGMSDEAITRRIDSRISRTTNPSIMTFANF